MALRRSRNEMMANAMVVRGLMEPARSGMAVAMLEFYDTEPELICDEEGRWTRVTDRLEAGFGQKQLAEPARESGSSRHRRRDHAAVPIRLKEKTNA